MHLSNMKEMSTPFLELGYKGQTFKGCAANNSSWQITVTARFHSGTSCPQRGWEKKKGEGKKNRPESSYIHLVEMYVLVEYREIFLYLLREHLNKHLEVL